MTTPDFLLIGAAKSGTTALWRALQEHPALFLPAEKEPHLYAFLADPANSGHLYADERAARAHVEALYAGRRPEQLAGEASTSSLTTPGVAALVAAEAPGARLVAVLRQPVERAFSHWSTFRAAGAEDLGFAEALEAEPARLADGWAETYAYLGWGRYAHHLEPWIAAHGRDRLLVLLHDELRDDPAGTLRTVCRFLGVDPEEGPTTLPRVNETPAPPPSRGLRARLTRRPPPPPRLDPATRATWTGRIEAELAALEWLLGRDLPGWR